MTIISLKEQDFARALAFVLPYERYCVTLAEKLRTRAAPAFAAVEAGGGSSGALRGVFTFSDAGQVFHCLPQHGEDDRRALEAALRAFFAARADHKLFSVGGETHGTALMLAAIESALHRHPARLQRYDFMRAGAPAARGAAVSATPLWTHAMAEDGGGTTIAGRTDASRSSAMLITQATAASTVMIHTQATAEDTGTMLAGHADASRIAVTLMTPAPAAGAATLRTQAAVNGSSTTLAGRADASRSAVTLTAPAPAAGTATLRTQATVGSSGALLARHTNASESTATLTAPAVAASTATLRTQAAANGGGAVLAGRTDVSGTPITLTSRTTARASRPVLLTLTASAARGARARAVCKIVRCTPSMAELLAPLQRAYEKEEVVFNLATYNANVSMLALKKTLQEKAVYAVFDADGALVAKGGTNAHGVHYVQLGGVYTEPAARGKGYASALIRHIVADFAAQQKQVALFVKPQNAAAQRLYAACGFAKYGEYETAYF